MAMSDIKGITIEIDGDTTKLGKALQGIQKDITGCAKELKEIDKLLKFDPSNTTLLQQKQQALGREIESTKTKLNTLKEAQRQMDASDVDKNSKAYEGLQREIAATEQNLRSLIQEQAKLKFDNIERLGQSLQSVGSKMESVGKSLTATVTAPLVGIGTAAVKTGMDFDEQMSKVAAISGATGDDFEALRAKAREMGASTKFSATEAAEAFEYMGMAGWKSGDMMEGIPGILNLAAASGEELGTTSDIVTDALTAFGLQAKDSGHFADILAAASTNANTNVSMLGESFKYAAPVAGSLGSSAEDTSIALGIMANSGIKASQAGTALRTGLSNMVKPSKQMATYMDRYNIELQKNDDGSINLLATMKHLRERMGGLSADEQAAAASAIFGKNAMSGWLSIINASDKDFDGFTDAIYNCDGAAETMADTMNDNLAGQLTILKSALQELAIQISDALTPTIKKIVEKIQDFVIKLQQMDEGTRDTILKIAAFAAAIGPVLIVVGKLVSVIGGAISTYAKFGAKITEIINLTKAGQGPIAGLVSAIGGISAPVLAVIAVIGILVAAFVTLWKTNEDFREKIKGVWDGIKKHLDNAFGKITEAVNKLGFNFKDITEVMKAAWVGFCNFLEPLITGIVKGIGTQLGAIIDIVSGIILVIVGLIDGFKNGDWTTFLEGIKSIFTGVINSLLAPFRAIFSMFGVDIKEFDGNWGELWKNVKKVFESVWNGIKSFFEGIWNGLKGIVTTVGGAIKGAVQTAFIAVKSIFETVWNGIKSFFEGIWKGFVTTVSTVGGKIKDAITKLKDVVMGAWKAVWEPLSTFLSKFWETLKSVVTVGILLVKEVISAAAQIIAIPFQFIWENCKGILINAWEGIKTAVSTALMEIQTAVTTVWNTIGNALSPILETIKTGISTAWEGIKTAVSTVLGAIQTAVTTTWNAVWTALSPILNTIKTGISTAWSGIKTALSTVLTGIKTAVTTAWTGIKTALSPILTAIKTAVSTAWNGIKTSVSTVVNGIKTSVSTAWNGIKSSVTTTVNGIKTSVTTAWNGIKTSVSTVMNGIKTSASTTWNGIKSSISTSVNGIKSAVSSAFNGAKSTATSVFNSIRTSVTNAMNSAKTAVTNAVNDIKNKFHFTWSLPHLKLPHISISGSFSLDPPSVPHFSINWYKKAMENGMILNSPTIFGMKGSNFLAGGEAGSETVVGTDSLLDMIRKAVLAGQNAAGKLTAINNYGNTYGDSTVNATINVYAAEGMDEISLARNVADIIQNQVGREAAVWA